MKRFDNAEGQFGPSFSTDIEDFTWTATPRAEAEFTGLINHRAKARIAAGPHRFHVIHGGRKGRR